MGKNRSQSIDGSNLIDIKTWVKKHTKEIHTKASTIIENYTIPLFGFNEFIDPIINYDLLASGVLIQYKSDYYLVSASHVFFDNLTKKTKDTDKIGFQINNSIITLGGELTYSMNDNEFNDNFDFAFIKLNDQLVSELSKIKLFYNVGNKYVDNIDFNNSQSPNFIIYGYPISRFKKDISRKVFNLKPFDFLTNLSVESNYIILNLDKNDFILSEYKKKKIKSYNNKSIIQGPNLEGVSGSGIWYVPSFTKIEVDYNDIKVQLVGINTTWHKNSNIIQSTKLKPIIEQIEIQSNSDYSTPSG